MAQTPFPASNQGFEFSISHWQDRFVLGILRAASVFGLVSMAGIFIDPTTTSTLRILYLVIYAVLLILTLAPVPYVLRAGFILLMAYLLGIIELTGGGLIGAARLYFFGTVLLANLLLSYRASIYAIIITTLTYGLVGFALLGGYIQPTLEVSEIGKQSDWLSSSATFIFLAATVNLAIQLLKSEFERAYQSGNAMLAELGASRRTLEERVAERTISLEKRTAELSAANTVTQSISVSNEIESLLPVVAHAITENFGYYHAGIYLLDEKVEYGYLQAASSEGGRRMLARGHQIAMFDEGLIQKAVSKHAHQVAQNIEADATRLEIPELAVTRARATFPLFARERAIGILDIHSIDPQAFQQSELETLQIVADQLSLAIDNARLFTEMQAIISQMQDTGEIRAHISWKELTKQRAPVYQYTPLAVQKIGAAPEHRDEAGSLSVPILLRGRSIGRIRLKRKTGAGTWLDQEQAMIQDVAAQIALALENARLLEDAQNRAQRERSLGEISARISAEVDVESILRTTIQEIGKALGDSEISVQLNPQNMDA